MVERVVLNPPSEALALLAPKNSARSHFQRFIDIRDEHARLKSKNPLFEPAFPAAWNPLLRHPVRPEGRVWIENEDAAEAVDLANSFYALMIRLLAYSYALPSGSPEKGLAVDLAITLMKAVSSWDPWGPCRCHGIQSAKSMVCRGDARRTDATR